MSKIHKITEISCWENVDFYSKFSFICCRKAVIKMLSKVLASVSWQEIGIYHAMGELCGFLLELDIKSFWSFCICLFLFCCCFRVKTSGTATEKLLSKRLSLSGRVLTRNGHDAMRELCGFFLELDVNSFWSFCVCLCFVVVIVLEWRPVVQQQKSCYLNA